MNNTQNYFYGKFIRSLSKSKKMHTAALHYSNKQANSPSYKNMNHSLSTGQPLFSDFSPQARTILEHFPDILHKILPLDVKKKQQLPQHIHDLFHELTDTRGSRKIHYLNNPAKLSAYMHYYLWWNLIRQTKLLQNMPIILNDNDFAADFGCGPLTFICALWIAQPALRKKRLTWYCIDISQKALAAGENLFLALCAYTEQTQRDGGKPWNIKKINGSFGIPLHEKVSLVTAANVFNEIIWNNPLPVESYAEKSCNLLSRYIKPCGSVILVEPGIPLAGGFISTIRKQFIAKGFTVQAPCPHTLNCPLSHKKNGQKTSFATQNGQNAPTAHNKWCHFVFQTKDCPKALLQLSDAANLGKERASLCFLYCTRNKDSPVSPATPQAAYSYNTDTADTRKKGKTQKKPLISIRICSDIIRLPNHTIGRYACSECGFMLLTTHTYAESCLHTLVSGSLLFLPKQLISYQKKDKKTGALLVNIASEATTQSF